MKVLGFILAVMFATCSAQDIKGYWKSMDEKTGKPGCMVAIYEHENTYYGRIVGTFDKTGKMTETIKAPEERAPGIVGNPFYCGLDLIWGLNKKDKKYKGKIVDPEKGNIYRAELWVEDGNLIVCGKYLCFWKNQTWLPAEKGDFPADFEKPDVKKFVPVIPQVD